MSFLSLVHSNYWMVPVFLLRLIFRTGEFVIFRGGISPTLIPMLWPGAAQYFVQMYVHIYMVVYRGWPERVRTQALQEIQAQFLRLYIAVLRGTHRHRPRTMYSQVLSSDIMDTQAVDSADAASFCASTASIIYTTISSVSVTVKPIFFCVPFISWPWHLRKKTMGREYYY